MTEEEPAQQREPDLSGLKPSTQEVIKGWIEDGTFIERVIGAMQEQEAENMRLDKALAEQPAQQEPVAWRWSESNGQRWFDWTTDWSHHDKAKSMGVPIEYAYTSPPARKPLTDKEIADIATSHPLTWVNLNTVEHRRYFARAIEAAHNIKEST